MIFADEWNVELDRRARDIETGVVVCAPIDDVLKGIRVELRKARELSGGGGLEIRDTAD